MSWLKELGGADGGLPDSQGSNISLDLSQDTVNQLLSTTGLSAVEGDNYIQQFHAELDADDEDPIGGGSTSISMSRAVICATTNVMLSPWPSMSQPSSQSSSQPSHPHTFSSTTAPPPFSPHSTSSSGHASSHSNGGTSPVVPAFSQLSASSSHSATPQTKLAHPLFDFNQTPTPSIAGLTPPLSSSFNPSTSAFTSESYCGGVRSNIPLNIPKPGDYGFTLLFEDEGKKLASKTASFTYSSKMQRLYIKQAVLVPFHFTITSLPPEGTTVRAMAIHKQPEMIAQNLTCCLKHVDEQKKKASCHGFSVWSRDGKLGVGPGYEAILTHGTLFPNHFIRSSNDGCLYYCDPITKRMSITVPFSTLVKKSEDTYTALFIFPCFSSEVSKQGQLIQAVFTLECQQIVLGRCAIDIRVCASPGRDRGVDERKGAVGVGGGEGEARPQTRKRAMTAADVVQCTLPPKQFCLGLSKTKVDCNIKTYPELIPFLQSCAQMLERLYSIRVNPAGGSEGERADHEDSEDTTFSTLESWLEHLGMSRYQDTLLKHGISSLFQFMDISNEELKNYGIRTAAHRKKLIDGKALIRLDGDAPGVSGQEDYSPPLFPSASQGSQQGSQSTQLLSQLSQLSSASSTQPFSQTTFEVLQIQLKKNHS